MKKNKDISEYMATIGARGGRSKSEKKAAAARRNGKKGGKKSARAN